MNIYDLHNKLTKRAKENSGSSLDDVLVQLGGTLAGMYGGEKLDLLGKIYDAHEKKELQRITERGKALKEKLPNLNVENYTRRAANHIANARNKQSILKQLLGKGPGKYMLAALAAAGIGGGLGARALYGGAKSLYNS